VAAAAAVGTAFGAAFSSLRGSSGLNTFSGSGAAAGAALVAAPASAGASVAHKTTASENRGQTPICTRRKSGSVPDFGGREEAAENGLLFIIFEFINPR
jgi:hypothetical protein